MGGSVIFNNNVTALKGNHPGRLAQACQKTFKEKEEEQEGKEGRNEEDGTARG